MTDEKAFIGQPQLEEHDAFYRYYKHGPLARGVLGQQQVQGVDNAYTLQGWLKGVNSMVANYAHDMGQDGLVTGKDAYGFQLNYFTNDYAAIKPGVEPFPGHTAYIGTEYKELFNGNISSMAVNINQFNQPQLYNYRYDQLNRIVRMDTYRGFNSSTNSWSGLTHTNDYRERVSYDANGNILTYSRYGTTAGGSPLQMDSLTYGYNMDDEKLLNNKLRHVKDAVNDGNYSIDIDGQGDDNYTYDAIGNLVSDTAEGIDVIEWTVYGKIAKIEKANGTTITYSYDVSGNRITKAVTTGEGTAYTSYVRDASGNVMAVYEQAAGQETMHLKEQHLYGSSRLGLWNRNQDIDQQNKWRTDNANLLGNTTRLNFERGNKLFELSNHLGNVLATVSDKKLATLTDMIYPHGGEAFEAVLEWGADVVTANDYYPFGMQMPGRKFAASNAYRYGFNGKENDNDVKGEGDQQDYGMRVYDPRVGRFLSVDPLSPKYPYYSPYHFGGNTPIWCIDLDGEEPEPFTVGKAVSDNRAWEEKIRKEDPINAERRIYEANKQAFLFVGSMLTGGSGKLFSWFMTGVTAHGTYKVTKGLSTGNEEDVKDGVNSLLFVAINKIAGVVTNKIIKTVSSKFFESSIEYGTVKVTTQVGKEMVEVGKGGINNNGYLELDIDVKVGANGEKVVSGEAVFDEIYSIAKSNAPSNFPLNGVKGTWTYGDNLATFNKLIGEKVNKGLMTLEEAALSTFTGKMASKLGFKNVTSINGVKNTDGTYKVVNVIFSK